MKFGICIPNYGENTSVDALRTVAVEAEKLSYDSVWTTDHILMPIGSGTPYERIFESITSLAYLASVTNTVKLGVSSLIMSMRNPVVVAKQLATVDHLSAGRIMLATSVEWNKIEFQHLGSDFRDRGRRLDDSIRLIRTLWSNGRYPEFEGKDIPQRFTSATFEPYPIQESLTIWVAGNSYAPMKRAVTLGDAWHPNVVPLDVFRNLVAQFRGIPRAEDKEICVRIGMNLRAARPEYRGPWGERRVLLSGNMNQNRKIITELETLGVIYMLIAVNPDGNVPIAEQLRNLRAFSEAFIARSS
jgi:alkanesulfonate monooxygenase SsuD/methylene tetrahydromethanopterin reductase-like flavin-dependent oxidoreductase (luciferase family)